MNYEKGSMVGSKDGRISPHDWGNGWVWFKFFLQECPNEIPIPSPRVGKIRIEGEVALVEFLSGESLGFGSAGRQVEQGQI